MPLDLVLSIDGADPTERPLVIAAREGDNASLNGIRILLAEDNLVNRTLAVALLGRRGAIVTVAVSGHEAVAAWRPNTFDVVLMDVQMPELDGLSATRRIRGLEAIAGASSRIPIIALTAHAMIGDRDRCLEAGMDGYVSKPIRAPELVAEIVRLLPVPKVESMAMEPMRASVFDLTGLRETAGDDDELVAEVIRLFIEDAPALAAAIEDAVAHGDRIALREAAHALKGAAGSLSAANVAASAAALEVLAVSTTPFAAAPALVARLRGDMSTLDRALRLIGTGAVAA
jgi:CheY-like chemotaxis protein